MLLHSTFVILQFFGSLLNDPIGSWNYSVQRGDMPNSHPCFLLLMPDAYLGGAEQLAVHAIAGLDFFNNCAVAAGIGYFDGSDCLLQVRIERLI